MVRNSDGALIGLFSTEEASKEGVEAASTARRRGVHVEFTTDDLDGLDGVDDHRRAAGIELAEPPHDEPWERAMTASEPGGHSVEFAQGPRGSFTTSTRPPP